MPQFFLDKGIRKQIKFLADGPFIKKEFPTFGTHNNPQLLYVLYKIIYYY